jgi:hypothetical protein
MSDMLVLVVCFVVPVVCLLTGAWLALTVTKANARARGRAVSKLIQPEAPSEKQDAKAGLVEIAC